MRVSQYFDLNRTQPTLDFVDVDIAGDIPVFLDPRALRLLHSPWAGECSYLIQNFFQTILKLINKGQNASTRRLLEELHEPNEVHLGHSTGVARGRALGRISASNVWQALSQSQAVKSGLLEDLEDTILMVEGIAGDIVSDISINIIRRPLIDYTQMICRQYGISLVCDVDSGPLWNPIIQEWESEFTKLPMTDNGKLILIPKAIVRLKLDYDADEYYRHYLLEYLAHQEKQANSELVQLLRDGRQRVTKKDLEQKYGKGKSVIVTETLQHPKVLEIYRAHKQSVISSPLTHEQFAFTEETDPPNWEQLYQGVSQLETGQDAANRYENAIEKLLSALFYPSLTNPQFQMKLHDGRKRIDITYTNVANIGYFYWLALHYSAPHIFVECKNYSGEIGNPEFDQLAGRFSPSRGQVGILVCRKITNKALAIKRSRDTAQDGRGYIIPIDDEDLRQMLPGDGDPSTRLNLLWDRFKELVV